jgi:hypothetical protein
MKSSFACNAANNVRAIGSSSYPAISLYTAVHSAAFFYILITFVRSPSALQAMLDNNNGLRIQHCHYYPALLAMLQQC